MSRGLPLFRMFILRIQLNMTLNRVDKLAIRLKRLFPPIYIVKFVGFLRVDYNKITRALSSFLRKYTVWSYLLCKVVVTTNGSSTVCSDLNHNMKNINPCDHEEADTMMLHHVRDTLLNESHTKQLICTNYSDVVVLAVCSIAQLQWLKELWLTFSIGPQFLYIASHLIALRQLGPKQDVLLLQYFML